MPGKSSSAVRSYQCSVIASSLRCAQKRAAVSTAPTSAQGMFSLPGSMISASNLCRPRRYHSARSNQASPKSRTRSTCSAATSATSQRGASGAGDAAEADAPDAADAASLSPKRNCLAAGRPSSRCVISSQPASGRASASASLPGGSAHRLAQRPVVVADVVDGLAMAEEEHAAKSPRAVPRQWCVLHYIAPRRALRRRAHGPQTGHPGGIIIAAARSAELGLTAVKPFCAYASSEAGRCCAGSWP